MSKINNLHYYFHNIKVTVDCPHKKTRNFLENSFFFFKKIKKYKFRIFVKIDFNNKKSFNELSKKKSKIGNHVLSDKDNLIFQNHGLIYIFKNKLKNMYVSVNKQKKDNVISKSKNIFKNIFIRNDNYAVIRQSIILPVIWTLSRKFNIQSLHGGAVTFNSSSLIFSGLAGVGKSNLTLFMTKVKKSLFLSDNFLIYDKKNIHPFPEWIRILKNSKQLMPELKKFFDQNMMRRNEKNYFRLSSEEISSKTKPKIFLFTEIGKNCNLKKVSLSYAFDRIMSSKHQVREFPEHNFIGLLDILSKKNDFNSEDEIKTLKIFLKKNACFIFTINKNLSIKKNLDFLLKKIR